MICFFINLNIEIWWVWVPTRFLAWGSRWTWCTAPCCSWDHFCLYHHFIPWHVHYREGWLTRRDVTSLPWSLLVASRVSCPAPLAPASFCSPSRGLPPCYLVLGDVCVAVPWAAGRCTQLCPLHWATLAFAGLCLCMPACPCEMCCLWSRAPAPPQQKNWVFLGGFGQRSAACHLPLILCRPGLWRAHFRDLGPTHSLGMSWVPATCSALRNACVCRYIQFECWFPL